MKEISNILKRENVGFSRRFLIISKKEYFYYKIKVKKL